MRHDTALTEAGRHYAAAYAAHYTERDLPAALDLYLKVIESDSGAQEANYARMQVQNIVNTVVPKQELLDAQVGLARAHLEHNGSLNAGRAPVTPLTQQVNT